MNEKFIEQKLATAVKTKGGIAPKFVSPSFAGMPDRPESTAGGTA